MQSTSNGLNILPDNAESMTHTYNTDVFTLKVMTTDSVTAEVVAKRLQTAITNLGDTAEVDLLRETRRTSRLDNQPF